MHKISLLGSVLLLSALTTWGAPCDDTVQVESLAGFSAGQLDPASALNARFNSCTDTAKTALYSIRFNGDTLRLTKSIEVNRTSKKPVEIRFQGSSGKRLALVQAPSVNENDLNSRLLVLRSPATVENASFVKRFTTGSYPVLVLEADTRRSLIRNCDFYSNTNVGSISGDLIMAEGSDTLTVDRCIFRAGAGGEGAIAIYAALRARMDIRSSLFHNTRIQIASAAGTNTLLIAANTFTGTIGSSSITTIRNRAFLWLRGDIETLRVSNNLFAGRDETIPPLRIDNLNGITDWQARIFDNAFVPASAAVRLTADLPADIADNVRLPQGFANYARRDFPLLQLRTDSDLNPSGAGFGRIPNIQTRFPNAASITPIKDIGSAFVEGNFVDHQGQSFADNVRVGAFGSSIAPPEDNPPSPLDSSGISGSLQVTPDAGNITRIRVTKRDFDSAYYGVFIAPSREAYFLSKSESNLAGNDTTALAGRAGVYKFSFSFNTAVPEITVPRELRLDTNPLFVKMVHANAFDTARVFGQANLAQVRVPKYPVTDITIAFNGGDTAKGQASFTVTLGREQIDSVRLVRISSTNSETVVGTFAVPSGATSLPLNNITVTERGSFRFQVLPIGRVSNQTLVGAPSASTRAIAFNAVSGTLFVRPSGCASIGNAKGTEDDPWCRLDEAINSLAPQGGTIVVLNPEPAGTVIPPITVQGAVAAPLEILSQTYRNPPPGIGRVRPIIRSTAPGTSAVTLSRPGVVLKGFTIEMPDNATAAAVSVKAQPVLLEANVVRPQNAGRVLGEGIAVESGAAEVSLLNNVVFNFSPLVALRDPSSKIRILNNTLAADTARAAQVKGVQIVNNAVPVIASNFFSAVGDPYAVTSAAAFGSGAVLERNVYTVANVNRRGATESPALAAARPLSLDLYGDNYLENLNISFRNSLECLDQARECSPLFAGGSVTHAVQTDLFGRTRLDAGRTTRNEVGALEYFRSSDELVLGRLELAVDSTPGKPRQPTFTITSLNLDPADASAVRVWWTLQANLNAANLASVQTSRSFPLADLQAGTITGTPDSLEGGRQYYFYAAFERTSGGSRVIGRPVSAGILIPVIISAGDCRVTTRTSCDQAGSGLGHAAFPNAQLRVSFAADPAGGSNSVVKAPFFETTGSRDTLGLLLTSAFPIARITVQDGSLEAAGSRQAFTAKIAYRGALDLGGQMLFDLKEGTRPALVPQWGLERQGDTAIISITDFSSGLHRYAFGTVKAGVEGGRADSVRAEGVLDRTASDPVTVKASLQGSGFLTSNPLILVTPLPAGGVGEPSPLRSGYGARNVLLTAGFDRLDSAFREEVLVRYYNMTAAAKTGEVSPVPGTVPPFALEALQAGGFGEVVQVAGGGVGINPEGAFATREVSFTLPSQWSPGASNAGKISRGLELLFTVIDAGRIRQERVLVRSKFGSLGSSDRGTTKDGRRWHLFTLPWDEEAAKNPVQQIFGSTESKPFGDNYLVARYEGQGGDKGYRYYTPENFAEAPLDSGRALWAASRVSYQPNSLGGQSLDHETFELKAPAGRWTDFGLPFNFPIKLADIRRASSPSDASAFTGLYRLDTRGGKSAFAPVAAGDTLRPFEGYILKPSGDVTLRFPVIEAARSAAAPQAKKAAPEGWMATLRAEDAASAMVFRIGKAGHSWSSGLVPPLPGQAFQLALRETDGEGEEAFQSGLVQDLADGAFGHWSLKTDFPGKAGVSLTLEKVEGAAMPLHLVETTAGKVLALRPGAPVDLSAEELKTRDYHVVAGDEAYVASVLDGLSAGRMLSLAAFPNPFRTQLRIRYALPESNREVRYGIVIRNALGKTVWRQEVQGGPRLDLSWNGLDEKGRLADRGFYAVHLEAATAGGKRFRAVKKLLKF